MLRRFLIRRVLLGLVVLWLVTLGTFFMFFVAPGDPARTLAGRQATPDQVEMIRRDLGLDQPILVQYGEYMGRLVRGDLGKSYFNGESVGTLVASDLPPTMSLVLGGAVLWFAAGVSLGVLSATRARSLLDRLMTFLALAGVSMPTFVIGLLMLYLLFFQLTKAGAPIFPPDSYVPFSENPAEWARHLILPWVTLATVQAATYLRLTRGSMLDVLGEDYIRTARAKGVPEPRVIVRHGLRSALTPVVSQLGVDVGTLIGGVVVTESVFGLGGVGQAVVQAFVSSDLPVIMGVVLITASAVVVANLLVDLAYALLDARVRLG
ncbi:peptide ABC transporter permease [Sphaerisporangium krabiense]|uniref:Peptide/nickel transport system permease protein n=1 Tax=Sphaerisporangium krabiense TaxID=763782 RepID=A0A7W8YZF6_9ACTN|nr:ABC transporter permease [Sphaerisporangium krabiense]MBB5624644.1 peptide/nickel transport system permease protein [Sphaerisporangium krabiense]GII61399.1 peptide ABC transporter permease [Sphaerisporangium krabiense]